MPWDENAWSNQSFTQSQEGSAFEPPDAHKYTHALNLADGLTFHRQYVVKSNRSLLTIINYYQSSLTIINNHLTIINYH